MVKNLLAMQETWAQSLGWEDPLEKGKATHSSILAWRIPWTEEPGGLHSVGSPRVGHDSRDLARAKTPSLSKTHGNFHGSRGGFSPVPSPRCNL